MTGDDGKGGDGFAARASSEFVRMFVLSALALALFSGGVYWIRQLPADSGAHDQGAMAREQQRLRQSIEDQLSQLRSGLVSAISDVDIGGDSYADAAVDAARLAAELVNLNMKLKAARLEELR